MPSTISPLDMEASVLGKAASAVNRANWVATARREVSRAMKATEAAVPRPTPRYSAPMTAANTQGSAPAPDSQTKPKMVASCTPPNHHRALLMPILTMAKPPRMPPMTDGQSAAFLAMTPICVGLKPMSM